MLKFSPRQSAVTASVLFDANDSTIEAVISDAREVEPQRCWFESRGTYSLADCFLGTPPQGSAHKLRVLAVYLPDARAVILTANLADGWSSLAYRHCIRSGGRALVLRFSENDEVSGRGFSYYIGPREERSVLAFKDSDGWKFSARGTVLSQENGSQYGSRRTERRVTNDYLMELASGFGVRAFRDAEVSGRGLLLVET